MIVVHSFRSLQETFEARASEWALTGVLISLSIVFLVEGDMFSRNTFDGLRSILDSHYGWSAILAVVGLTRLSVLVVNGYYWRTPHLRSLTAFLSAGIWFLFCAGFARHGSIMVAVAPWIFLLDAYNAKRAGHEAGKSEYIQRYHTQMRRGKVNAGLARGPGR